MPAHDTPEQRARRRIDTALTAAGWVVQDRSDTNLSAGLGIAIREFRMAADHGFADYLLFVDGKAVGALEAKPEGCPLSACPSGPYGKIERNLHGLAKASRRFADYRGGRALACEVRLAD